MSCCNIEHISTRRRDAVNESRLLESWIPRGWDHQFSVTSSILEDETQRTPDENLHNYFSKCLFAEKGPSRAGSVTANNSWLREDFINIFANRSDKKQLATMVTLWWLRDIPRNILIRLDDNNVSLHRVNEGTHSINRARYRENLENSRLVKIG